MKEPIPAAALRAFENNARVYVQAKPDDESLQQLLDVQRDVLVASGGRKTSAERLHLTLLHFGKPQEVLHELRRRNDQLTRERFMAAVEGFILQAATALPEAVTLQAAGLNRYGPARRVVALEIAGHEELWSAHDKALGDLSEFFKACGIEDAASLISKSPNFRYAADFHPHITLVRDVKGSDVPDTDVPAELTFLPSYIDVPTL